MIESDLISDDEPLATFAWAMAAGALWLVVGIAAVVIAPALVVRRVLGRLLGDTGASPILPIDPREQATLDELRRRRALALLSERTNAGVVEPNSLLGEPAGSHPPTVETAGAGLAGKDVRP